MRKYRIVKKTYADDSVKFSIEIESLAHSDTWLTVTHRDSLEQARSEVISLKGKELVCSEVVE